MAQILVINGCEKYLTSSFKLFRYERAKEIN